jgi:transposase-like protein
VSRVCTVCTHDELDVIDRALVGGATFRDVARQHGLSRDAIARHRATHLPEKLAQAQGATETAEATDLLCEVRLLRSKAYSLLVRAEKTGDIRTALAGIRESRACLELLAELEGKLNRGAQVTVLLDPQWITIRGSLLDALAPYPEARAAVGARLLTLESTNGHAGV